MRIDQSSWDLVIRFLGVERLIRDRNYAYGRILMAYDSDILDFINENNVIFTSDFMNWYLKTRVLQEIISRRRFDPGEFNADVFDLIIEGVFFDEGHVITPIEN